MELAAASFDVSRETRLRLQALEALLLKWNPAINLVSKASIASAWSRHIMDSVQLYDGQPFETWADLGSGGGFPGLVIAILAVEHAPHATVTLVEVDQRKATFLRQAARELDLGTNVVCERIEAAAPIGADILSARALAPLVDLCGFAHRHLAEGGTALFPKGKTWEQELSVAKEKWRFDVDVRKSVTDPLSVVLVMKGICHA